MLSLPAPAVVVLMGCSGSGKSTVAAALAAGDPGTAVVSYDRCREDISGDASDQAATADAIALAHRRLGDRCAQGLGTVVDGTHLVAAHRRQVAVIATAHQHPVVLVVVDTPLEVCLYRQLARPPRAPGARWGRRVPADVVRAQHADLVAALPGLHTEGHAAVHILCHPMPAADRPDHP
ncbi:AAA family ATPase [Actinokineospora sp. PR83]|uniref:AAA family ATPase n=1 Tax=Actinokineospora sp. PR83 TaxID=2884908 RepID=UPI001F3EEBB2|nr:AAA family ATPase [Actinokineospora sp. PR83]MCG8918261.1 AAA family ATPase [Actinokineospora sp. PR83]